MTHAKSSAAKKAPLPQMPEKLAFPLPEFPFAMDALEPHMSAITLDLHYDKHHRGYATKLDELVHDTPYAKMTLEQVVCKSHDDAAATAIFNNAAQHLNHSFFWTCMTPDGEDAPENLRTALAKSFGAFERFKQTFIEAGVAQFGSGWVWLVQNGDALEIVKTGNAETPITDGKRPLLVCDVWEHAYYVDHQNRRAEYLKIFLDELVDWSAVAKRLGVK